MSVEIKITGAPEEVAEAVRRHRQLFDVVGHSPQKRNRQDPRKVRVFLEAEVVDRNDGAA